MPKPSLRVSYFNFETLCTKYRMYQIIIEKYIKYRIFLKYNFCRLYLKKSCEVYEDVDISHNLSNYQKN